MEELIYKYLDNNLNPEEKEELLIWLTKSQDNQKYFLGIYRIWITTQYNGEKKIPISKEFNFLQTNIISHADKAKSIKRRNLLKKIYLAIGAVACIIGAIIFVSNLDSEQQNTTNLLDFVSMNQSVNIYNTETTLILSDNKVVVLNQDETSISYAGDSIKTNSEKFISKKESNQYNQLIVPYGKKSTITFSDGTKLWANAGTRLVYPTNFDSKKREIFVEGEIYLDVAPDNSKPFIVNTENINVKVLGTKFGVTDYKTDIKKRVVLVSGSVKVKSNYNKRTSLLEPNEMYEINDNEQSITITDVEKYISWINGVYIFDKEPLKDVLSRMSRFYDIVIDCDANAATLLCSGTLDVQVDIEEIFVGLAYSIPIIYEKEGERYKIRLKN